MSQKPKRIQRKRTKGWKMPPNTVYVGRPTKWGNPLRVTQRQTIERVMRNFRQIAQGMAVEIRSELRGKDLACWCPLGQACHADVLLEIANKEPSEVAQ